MRTILTGALLACACVLGACTSSSAGPTPAPSTRTVITTGTRTSSPSIGPTAPVNTGPTTTTTQSACPIVATQSTANRVGMRLARITVQRSAGTVVGCRFYALQNSPYNASEHLPGPNQPAVEIVIRLYASADAAHNAFVLVARKGTNPQQETINAGNIGVCYQTAFYPRDHGTDWACAYSLGERMIVIRTVLIRSAFSVVQVAREVAGKV